MDNEIIQEETAEVLSQEETVEAIPQEVSAEAQPMEVPAEEFPQEPAVMPEEAPKGIKKLIKKWWFWVIIALLLAGIVAAIIGLTGGSGGSGSPSSTGSSYVPTVSPYVRMVKEAKNSNYGITYGAAFDSFFSNPRWSYFEASSGEDVVEFTGNFYYKNEPAKAKIQFVLDLYNGTMEVYHLSINGEAQSRMMLLAMLEKVFESY